MFRLLFVLLCAIYLLLMAWTAPLPAAFLKILPIQMLVVRAASQASRNQRIPLTLGLIFSLAGDVILALSPEALFIQGVAAFFIAHAFYIVAFRRAMSYSKRGVLLAAVVIAWCATVGSVVFPHLGTLAVPVVAYMIVITAMGVSAGFATGPTITLFAGASAFIVSDSMIAVDRFVTHFRYAPYFVMAAYYFGQFYIVEGTLGRRSRAFTNATG